MDRIKLRKQLATLEDERDELQDAIQCDMEQLDDINAKITAIESQLKECK